MRLHGFCTECHRPRLVRVSGHGLTLLAARGIVEGICDECEQRQLPGGRPPGVFDLRRQLGRAPTVAEYRAARGHRT